MFLVCFAGRTAPSSSPISAKTALAGEYSSFDISSSFSNQDGALVFQVRGFPRATGFRIDQNAGIVFGMPSAADQVQVQPLRIVAVARNGNDQVVEETFSLYINEVAGDQHNPIVSVTIPPATAFEGKPFLFRFSKHFVEPNDGELAFGQKGLPEGTGIRLNENSGVLYGAPNEADRLAPQPMPINLVATNGKGMRAEQILLLKVISNQGSTILFLVFLFGLVI